MEPSSWIPFVEGFSTGAGLIIAIGPQNAFVLKQGIQKNYLFTTAFLCFLFDSLLISLGVGGMGEILATNPALMSIARWGGAAFLGYYGARSFRNVFTSHALAVQVASAKPSLRKTVLTLLALSFLNPHVYLDAMVLLGSIGAQFPPFQRPFFVGGALGASFLWFFSLSYGAQFLGPLFKNPFSWKVLDFIIGCIMWAIGGVLLSY